MPAEITLPVYVRVGDHPEAHFGDVTIGLTDVTIGLTDGLLDKTAIRTEMAAFLRAAADAIENPSEEDEGVPDAATHG